MWEGKFVEEPQPHFDESYESAMAEWLREQYEPWLSNPDRSFAHEEIDPPPDPAFYRPDWSDEDRTHLMLYSNTTEGTPYSPAFETPEALARWLVDNKVSSFGYSTATYEQWLSLCKGGCAPSMVATRGGLMSGVEALGTCEEAP